MNIKIKSIIFPICIISLSVLLTMILILTKEDAKKEIFEKQPLSIETFKAKEVSHRIYIESESKIEPKFQLSLAPYVSGEIIYVSNFLDNGLIFNKGDLLIQIDSADYSIARINSKARLDVASLDYKLKEADSERSKEELNTYKYSNATDLAKKIPQLKSSKSLLEAAKANYKKTILDLERTSIVAPFNGRVESNFSTKGMKVSPIDRLAIIYSADSFKIELPISISDIQHLGISKDASGFIQGADLKIDITSEIGNDIYKYSGKYSGISGIVDQLTQTVKMKVLLDNNDLTLPVDKGIFAESKIYGKTYDKVFVLPNQSINDDNEVYVVTDNILIKQKVEIIKRYKDSTIVKSGIKNGDIINMTPISIYVDSMKVNVLKR